MNLSKIRKIYIIGIEGAGTSALARMFKEMEKEVSGSDEGDHFYYDVLENKGIKVFHKFDKNNIPKDIDLIIYSIAFNSKTNPEVAEAFKRSAIVMTYGEALSILFNQKYGIAVCGSHGKTTITAWLSFVMQKSGLSPNMIVGAKIPQFKGNSLVGNSDYLIIEADEYGNKLQYYAPKTMVLNNIDYDHPDFFKTKKDYKKVFADFVKKISKTGFLIANFDDPNVRKIAEKDCKGEIISYAIDNNANYVAYDIKQRNNRQCFKIKFNNEKRDASSTELLRRRSVFPRNNNGELGDFCIKLSGKHNTLNALAVIAASIKLGINIDEIKKYLANFTGADRRMQIRGKFNNAIIIDDYAHHPTEIKATLQGARELYKDKKILTVFHPHTFTRTKALFNDFVKSFKNTDELIILDIYGSAREKQGGVHSKDLIEKIGIRNKELGIRQGIKSISTLEECEKYLRDNIGGGYVVILMGAGDVFRIGEGLVKNQKSKYKNQNDNAKCKKN